MHHFGGSGARGADVTLCRGGGPTGQARCLPLAGKSRRVLTVWAPWVSPRARGSLLHTGRRHHTCLLTARGPPLCRPPVCSLACTNVCRGAFMQVNDIIQRHFPGVEVVPSNYPLPPLKVRAGGRCQPRASVRRGVRAPHHGCGGQLEREGS